MDKIVKTFAALDDDQLLQEVKVLVARERDATTVLVLSLAEVDARRLYLPLGYSSLFKYCLGELQLSRSAAYSRIHAARTLRAFPAAVDHLADGSITLTNLNVLGRHLTTENHVALLQAAQYRTKEEVERQMAALSPGAPDIVTIHLRVRAETREKLRRAQDLWGPVEGGATADILDRALSLLIEEMEKKKLAIVKRPRRPLKMARIDSRNIPAWMKRTVARRDGRQCAFVGSAGRCTETSGLHFHHVDPVGFKGPTILENLQLRCGAHNRYEGELIFGPPPLSRKAAKRPDASARRKRAAASSRKIRSR